MPLRGKCVCGVGVCLSVAGRGGDAPLVSTTFMVASLHDSIGPYKALPISSAVCRPLGD